MKTFSQRNRVRCESPKGFGHRLDSWSLSDWACALTGEIGEACNLIKKLNRYRDGVPGNTEPAAVLLKKLGKEIADAAIYLDLLAQAAGFDLEKIREEKFRESSERIGYKEEE
jgi:NTP pyrophosphatase (non-canonical NTP hydrolase)